MTNLEVDLFVFIKKLYQEIKDLHPKDGLSSPRDIGLAKEINEKTAVLDKLQESMRIINPLFEIGD